MILRQILKYRFWVLWIFSAAVLGWYFATDPDGGAETMARVQWLLWLIVCSGPTYLLRKALMPGDSKTLFREAQAGSLPAAVIWASMAILSGILFLALASMAHAAPPPVKSLPYLPVLGQELAAHWPDISSCSTFAGQIEQETCPSLTSSKCWNPRAELKTTREYGFGLGQLTVTSKFDNFAAARGLHPSLRDWEWPARYDAGRQIRTMILMDKGNYRRLPFVKDGRERLAMMLAGYNGGMSGVLADRRLCAAIDGCNPDKWFGHVERHSLKNKVAARGYGKSFFEINRDYPRNILGVRRSHYTEWFGEAI
jgi:hypothetical protein